MLAEEMSMETDIATWLCVLKYKIPELSVGILRPS
jgi:hypothetical protein